MKNKITNFILSSERADFLLEEWVNEFLITFNSN